MAWVLYLGGVGFVFRWRGFCIFVEWVLGFDGVGFVFLWSGLMVLVA